MSDPTAADPAATLEHAWAVLDTVGDPELPALSLRDLGIVRDIVENAGGVEVVLTPTYSGCPATEVIEASVREALAAAAIAPVRITQRRAPAWTTDWISESGRRKLRDYGIAPPGPVAAEQPMRISIRARGIDCPRCGSPDTERLSAFGATACKALYRCRACREPFEHFKPI
ncbi:MAG: phenylacetate-CoA oxygenase subunit PaaJ [Burkholderiales bacterium]|nr:phenylacetate-CoA oxygenase subunit PaaJ [Burkholderiales bacterium]MDE2397555.1 phenylacetate-CoA oxygenase subunit PaaJ [Burkholderiales bacterium]MDE2454264.1 phenylacetate-CoA oxygenase subunit PaaJ [Burkholderiales bacterium]